MSIQVFANHAHVFPRRSTRRTIDRLLRMLDTCGIAEAVCFAPFAYQIAGAGIHHNEWLNRELANQPRLQGFGTVDLRHQVDKRPIKDQVRHARDLGLRGLKLHPNAQEFDILDPLAIEAYAPPKNSASSSLPQRRSRRADQELRGAEVRRSRRAVSEPPLQHGAHGRVQLL